MGSSIIKINHCNSEKFSEKVHNTLDELIRYLRAIQKDYIEKETDISADNVMSNMLQQGSITPRIYLSIKDAIENYNTPYELIIKNKEDKKYYIPDPETGINTEVSKEQHELFLKIWDETKPKLLDKSFGKAIITGTSVGISKSEDQLLHEHKGFHHDNPMDNKWIDKQLNE